MLRIRASDDGASVGKNLPIDIGRGCGEDESCAVEVSGVVRLGSPIERCRIGVQWARLQADEADPRAVVRTVAAWALTLLLFFPLGWLLLTSFKTELQAIHVPPLFFFKDGDGNHLMVAQV